MLVILSAFALTHMHTHSRARALWVLSYRFFTYRFVARFWPRSEARIRPRSEARIRPRSEARIRPRSEVAGLVTWAT